MALQPVQHDAALPLIKVRLPGTARPLQFGQTPTLLPKPVFPPPQRPAAIRWVRNAIRTIEKRFLPLPQTLLTHHASHELAHAIVAKACGFHVTTISTRPEGISAARIRSTSPRWLETDEFYPWNLQILVAGYVGVRESFNNRDWAVFGTDGDLKDIHGLLHYAIRDGIYTRKDVANHRLIHSPEASKNPIENEAVLTLPIVRKAVQNVEAILEEIPYRHWRKMVLALGTQETELGSEKDVELFLSKHMGRDFPWQRLRAMAQSFSNQTIVVA